MEKKPEQLQFRFEQNIVEIAGELRVEDTSATLICFNTARMDQHISKVHRDLMRRGFGLSQNDELVAG